MDDIEILDTMEPEEFARAVKKECVEADGYWVIRLLYEDGTVKYVRNLAVPVEDDISDAIRGMSNLQSVRLRLVRLASELHTQIRPNYRLGGYKESAEIASRPDAAGEWEECCATGNIRIVIDVVDDELVAKYKKWKADSDHEPTILED